MVINPHELMRDTDAALREKLGRCDLGYVPGNSLSPAASFSPLASWVCDNSGDKNRDGVLTICLATGSKCLLLWAQQQNW